eukprot:6022550-Pyramimonas_sp.AAC.1
MQAYPSSQGLWLHRPKTHRYQYRSRSRTRRAALLSPLGPWLAWGAPCQESCDPEAVPPSWANSAVVSIGCESSFQTLLA